MEKLIQPYDMECMKMAILKHEETFRRQVYELHRLYQIQRMLMKNMQNQETWTNLKNQNICFDYQNNYKSQEQPISNEYEIDNDGSPEESEIELTLGPTSYHNRRKLISTTSIASFSSSSTGSSDKSRIMIENSRVLNAEEQMRQVDRSLNPPPWLHQVLI